MDSDLQLDSEIPNFHQEESKLLIQHCFGEFYIIKAECVQEPLPDLRKEEVDNLIKSFIYKFLSQNRGDTESLKALVFDFFQAFKKHIKNFRFDKEVFYAQIENFFNNFHLKITD